MSILGDTRENRITFMMGKILREYYYMTHTTTMRKLTTGESAVKI
jgi:hypothetical protein